MNIETTKKLVHEGDLAAEVAVQLVEEEGEWAPYLSVEDASKLDDVRDALRAGDLGRAAELADHVYRLMPLTATDVS
jgi:hypothetical protein